MTSGEINYKGHILPTMKLLGYAHGITVIIPSDISPDMFVL